VHFLALRERVEVLWCIVGRPGIRVEWASSLVGCCTTFEYIYHFAYPVVVLDKFRTCCVYLRDILPKK
jgi:hypothetical protein